MFKCVINASELNILREITIIIYNEHFLLFVHLHAIQKKSWETINWGIQNLYNGRLSRENFGGTH